MNIELDRYYIVFSRIIKDGEVEIPKMQKGDDGVLNVQLPNGEAYQDIIEILQHIESFGAIDNRLSKIDMENLTYRWIPENERDHHHHLAN